MIEKRGGMADGGWQLADGGWRLAVGVFLEGLLNHGICRVTS